jgi:hypothetical protein
VAGVDQPQRDWLVEQRYRAVLEVRVSEVALRYGVSRHAVYSWKAKYDAAGVEGLREASRRPKRAARRVYRPRSRPWCVRCAGSIRGGVPGGSRSSSTGPVRRRRRGPRCIGSWITTASSWPGPFAGLPSAQAAISGWVHAYNYERPH